MKLSVTLFAIGIIGFGVSSGQELQPGIIGEDSRVLLESAGVPWDAIGKLNVSTYGGLGECSGTLVAPTVVITAAHCVVDAFSGPVPPQTVHFLAGLRGAGNYRAHSIGECLHFLKDYAFVTPNPSMPAAYFETDVVAIVLKDEVNVAPMPVEVSVEAEPGLHLVHVGYPADHRLMPWAHFDCQLLRSDIEGPLWFNDCDTHPGSSGGPILIQDNGNYKLAAIMLSGSKRLYNIGLPATVWRDLITNTDCP